MKSELEVRNYRLQLEKELNELNEERKALLSKLENGENFTKKDSKKNQELVEKISELKGQITICKNFELCKDTIKKFNALVTSKKDDLTDNDKQKIANTLKTNIRKFNKMVSKDILDNQKFSDKDVTNLKNELDKLNIELEILNKNGINTLDTENRINEINDILADIEEYKKLIIDEKALVNDLKVLTNDDVSESDKKTIIIYYTEKLEIASSNILEYINIIVPKQKDDKDEIISDIEKAIADENNKKEQTEEELEEKNRKLIETLKKIGKYACVAVATAALVLAIKTAIDKDNKNTKNVNTDDEPNTTKTDELTTTETKSNSNIIDSNDIKVSALRNLGYSEYAANMIVNNFSEEETNKLLNTMYIPAVENYCNEKEFKLDYLSSYEDVREMFNTGSKKTVDYVNRSYEIQKTNFYEDADILEIVPVLISLDNKDTWNAEHANIAQSFNTAFNRIMDNWIFDNVNEEDIEKIDALKYLYRDGTDEDKFLEQYSEIVKNVLANRNNKEEVKKAQEDMFNHIAIFATSLNGFTGEKKFLTNDNNFNKNAQINDYLSYYIISQGFIYPIIGITEPLESMEIDRYVSRTIPDGIEFLSTIADPNIIHEEIVKYGWEKYENTVNRLIDIEEIKGILETSLEGPEFTYFCTQDDEQKLTLGGE